MRDPSGEMKITALAPWFGGKRNLAGDIVSALGTHRVYWELFCGSMAVLLSKPPCMMETAVDLHGDLINLARVIQDDSLSVQLFEKLNRTLICEPLHRDAAIRYRDRGNIVSNDTPCVQRAYDYFICSWIGRNGVAGTTSYNQGFCARYTANGGHAAKRWISAIQSIPAWHHRLMNVTILNRNVFEVIARIADESGTVIYADPPYLVKASKYVHDFTPHDHVRLADSLHRFKKTRVVLSYYDHPRLQELYPGWRFNYIEVHKSLSNQNSPSGGAKAVEVLITNEHASGKELFA